MGSNQNLKAYVRYDGSNRVVGGSLIFRRKKPKVGKWHEIAISECCEYIPTSTTTSTSTSTTTTTTTAPTVYSFTAGYGFGSAGEACFGGMTQTFYTPGPLQYGTYPQTDNVIYTDQAMTQLATYPYIAATGIGQVWQCINGVLSNQQSCF